MELVYTVSQNAFSIASAAFASSSNVPPGGGDGVGEGGGGEGGGWGGGDGGGGGGIGMRLICSLQYEVSSNRVCTFRNPESSLMFPGKGYSWVTVTLGESVLARKGDGAVGVLSQT